MEWGIYIKSLPFKLFPEMKDLPSRDWYDENGDDEFVPDSPVYKAYEIECEFVFIGVHGTANVQIKSFLNYLAVGGKFKMYDTYTKIGRTEVRYMSYSEDVLYRREGGDDIVVFSVKLKVNDMDAWLPHTQKDYWAKYGHKLDVLGTVFDDGITGLVVPAYVNIESIEELNENKDKFDKKIYGIAAGAGIHANTEKAIKAYNLDYSQISSSETSMITALKKADKNKEWIVITGWKPHFMWTEFELKKLSDPKGIYPTDNIQVISRRGFKEDKPDIAAFFESFKLDDKLLHELIIDVSMHKDPQVGAKVFFEKHPTFL